MDRVYIAGFFDAVNGDSGRSDAAVLDGTTGAPVPGMYHVHQNTNVNGRYQQDVVWADNKVFIGGSQHNVHVYDEATFTLQYTHMDPQRRRHPGHGGLARRPTRVRELPLLELEL